MYVLLMLIMFLSSMLINRRIQFRYLYHTADSNANWLTPEVLSLFIFHDIRNLSRAEELHITESMVSLCVRIGIRPPPNESIENF